MNPEVIVNVRPTHTATCDGLSRNDLLAWVNNALKANFAKVDYLCTGAAYCQLMHSLFPNQVSLKRVKFLTNLEIDCLNNFKILQATFQKLGVQKSIPIERLCKGKFQDNIEFLQWFKKFYEANDRGYKYDPVAARNGESIGYGLKVMKRNSARHSKPSSPVGNRETSRSANSQIHKMAAPMEMTLKRSLTRIHIKKNDVFCEKPDAAPEVLVEFDEMKLSEESDILIEKLDKMEKNQKKDKMEKIEKIEKMEKKDKVEIAKIMKLQKDYEENRAETAELQEKLNQLDFELKEVMSRLESVKIARDNFYRKLKDIGSCIKEAEDAGFASIETLKITHILLGAYPYEKKDKKESINGEKKNKEFPTE